ncbi:O-antigen ligase family protein, partial [Patescibacteria group bacterium AH-259-L05]|nr:O-antigen ligase family protein [Patescibacteria group bacterium AH-259-L05]
IVILFLPLLVYRPVLFPYIFSKVIVFQILVEIIFVAWLFLAMYGDKQYRPHWRNPLVVALSMFMGILILTALAGVDFYKSFWSSQERMTGIVTMFHFYALFIVLISVFKNWSEWRQFIYVSLIVSFLVGLYGLGQKLGFKFLLKEEGVQMTATLGNPIFLAVYAMLNIFWAGLILVYNKKDILQQKVVGSLLVFNVVILFLAASRGVMVAFSLSLLVLTIFLLFSRASQKTKIGLSILLIIFTVTFFIMQLPQTQPLVSKAPYFIRRFANLSYGMQERTTAWEVGWRGFKQSPTLGWGWENYNIVFNKHYNPLYLRKGQENTWFDRSHNQMVDLLALTGALGALVYLSIFGSIFYLLWQRLKKIENYRARISIMILGLMFLAYFVQNLFVFDTPAPLIVFYFSLGLVYFITQRSDLQVEVRPQKRGRFPLPVLIFLIIVFLPLAIYKFNVEPFQQSRLAIRGVHTSKVDLKSGFHWYQKALEKESFVNPEIRVQLAKTVSEQYAQKNPDTQTVVAMTEFAISEHKKNVEEHPLDVRHYLYLGQLHNLGTRYKPDYFEDAERVLQKALELSPSRQQTYFELARIEIIRRNYDKAIELLEKTVKLDTEVKESQFNLSVAYLADGQLEKGIEAAERAWELNYRWWENAAFMLQLVQAYIATGDYNKAIQQYRWTLYIKPKDANLYFKLAQIYVKTGNNENAQESAEKALEFDPSLKDQIDEFLKQLE